MMIKQPGAADGRRSPRVLVADDDAIVRALVSASLKRLGFQVKLAIDGLAAIEAARAESFDLVVLDVQMPGADGFEVCRTLRRIDAYRLTPILMATGLDDHESIDAAFDAGASDFVVKPLNIPLLNHRVRFLMKSAETVGELEDKRARLDEALVLAKLAHWSYDPATRRIDAADSGYQLHGFAKSSIPMEQLVLRIPPEDRARVREQFVRAQRSPETVEFDHRLLDDEGNVRHVRAVLQGIRAADGTLLRVAGSSQDVTEQRRLDETMRLWSQVIETTSEGMLIADGEYRPLQVNGAFCRITGHTLDELARDPSIAWPAKLRRLAGEQPGSTGSWQGEREAHRRDGETYHQWLKLGQMRGADGAVTHHVMMISDISELKKSQSRLDFLAWHDPLTGLPNRAALTRHLESVLAREAEDAGLTGVLYIDLDRFKNVNDSLGHPFGDRLLRAIVARLRARVPAGMMLARIGGDEFVAVLESLPDEVTAETHAAALLAGMQEPFRLDNYEFAIGASIGVCMHPAHGASVDELVRNADAAMFRAKEEGRGRFRVYNERMSADAGERMSIETDLRSAVARDELVLFYQPKVDLASGRLIGAEALVRWRHPTRGMVSPAVFIPIAEDSGLIADIGQWVIEQAARDAMRWCRGPDGLDHIAVNVAGPQIWRSDFVDHVRRTLEHTGLPAHALQVEITETLVMNDATQEDTLRRLNALRELGMTMAIDDFGTGHSSLSYLKRLPISTLKIDQSFVRDVVTDASDAAIVRTIIALADNLQLKLVAEGVETVEQRQWLLGAGCPVGQGYLFSRPVPAEQFEALVGANSKASGRTRTSGAAR